MSKWAKLTTDQVLGSACAALSQSEQGWNDLCGGEDSLRQWNGLKSMITAARTTTWILQKLSSRESTFDAWYAPIQDEMAADELLRYFHRLRTVIEKEGMPQPIIATVEFLEPANGVVATAEVGVGEDQFGLWIHGVLDKGPQRRSAEVAAARAATHHRLRDVRLPDPPAHHQGQLLEDRSIEYLGRRYLDYLDVRIVRPACETFGKRSQRNEG